MSFRGKLNFLIVVLLSIIPMSYPFAQQFASQIVTVASDGSGNFTTIDPAVASLGSAGGQIIVKPGIYPPATITSNIWLQGSGFTSIIQVPAGSQANGISILNATNVRISNLKVIGNWDPAVAYTGPSYTSANGIRIFNSAFVTIDGNFVTQTYFGGITADTSVNITIFNNRGIGTRDNGIFLRPHNDTVEIYGNTMSNSQYSGIQCLRSNNINVHDNTSFHNGPTQGQGDGVGSEGCTNVTIAHNTLYGNGREGVKVDYTVEGASTPQRSNNVLIINNTINSNAHPDGQGILVTRSDNTTITGNHLSGNFYGISVGEAGKVTIDGNIVDTSNHAGIRFFDPSAFGPFIISNNYLQKNTGNQIEVASGNTQILNNILTGGLSGSIVLTGGSAYTITGNRIDPSRAKFHIGSGVQVNQSNNTFTNALAPFPTPTAQNAQFTYTPFPTSTALPAFIASVDTMKDSMDTSAPHNQISDAAIASDVNLAATMNLTHITVDTFMDYPDYMLRWINAVRATGKHVWFRVHFNAWEGNNGAAASMTPSQYIAAEDTFIRAHPTFFQPGDIADFNPEPENSPYWEKTYGNGWGSINAPNAATDEFNRFQVAVTDTADTALEAVGIHGVITTIRSTNAWWPLHPKSYYPSTVARMGNVAIDTYPDSGITDPTQAAQARVNEMQQVWNTVQVPIIVAEMGYDIHHPVDDQTQANVIMAELSAMDKLPYLKGINYWVGAGVSDPSRLFAGTRGNWQLRPAGIVLSNFYATKTQDQQPDPTPTAVNLPTTGS